MLHIERLTTTIDNLSVTIRQNQQQRHKDIDIALQWLNAVPDPDALRTHIAGLRATTWSGAIPMTQELLNARYTTTEQPPRGTMLIAVDGSQIFPDRHAAVLYYLIQVGGLTFCYDGSTPVPHNRPALYFEQRDIYNEREYLISAEKVGRQRLVAEMAYLAELAANAPCSVPPLARFAVTDGPLLWPYPPERNQKDFLALRAYLAALGTIRQAQTIPVGYVDRPGGRALLDLLWAAQLSAERLHAEVGANPLQFLSDEQLMQRFLAPGEHTVWFKRETEANQQHASAGHEIGFCYFNVGSVHQPAITRVEVPIWATEDKQAMTILYTALYDQARVLNGYPYVLARAHEEALVTTKDKTALDSLIQQRLLAQGVMARTSEKARQKSYLGRR